MIKLGLCSVSFRKHTPTQIMSECLENDIRYIEWGSDIHAPIGDASSLKKLASEQEKYNISCQSYGTYFRVGANRPDEILSYIEAAKILGANTLRIWCGTKNSKDYSESEREALFKECAVLAQYAKNEGVTLCSEFHGGTFTNCFESSKLLLSTLNSENFKTYWQPNQFKSFEENLSCAEAIAEYTRNIHVFNWKGDENLPLHLAKNEWKSYLDCFKKSHIAYLEFMPDGKMASLKTEANTLKTIIGD